MRAFPKWPLFIVLFSLILATLGSLTDGVLAPASGMETKFSRITASDPVSSFLALKDILFWQYGWANGYWQYFTMFLAAIQSVLILLILIEVAAFIRELTRL